MEPCVTGVGEFDGALDGRAARAAVAQRLLSRLPDLTRDLVAAWATDLVELQSADRTLAQTLSTLAQGTIVDTLDGLADLDPDLRICVENGPVAIRVLEARGVARFRIGRLYLLAQQSLVDVVLRELHSMFPSDLAAGLMPDVVTWQLTVFSANSETLSAELAGRGEHPGATPGNALNDAVEFVLDRVEDPQVAGELLRYRVDARHIGIILWSRRGVTQMQKLVPLVQGLTDLTGIDDVLVIPRDHMSVHAWLTVGGPVPHLAAQISRRVGGMSDVRMAVGEAGDGLQGFKVTHDQALAAQRVAHLTGSAPDIWVRYRDIAPSSLLSCHPELVEPWVRGVLGELGDSGEDTNRLRETLRVYLETGENASAAASRLYVHRNTVKYRVQRATQLLSVSLEQNRLSVAIALNYRRWAMPG